MPPSRQQQLHNLPLQLTSFIGREREIAEVRRLLSSCRLLTLTGAGGIGKTRLAIEAAGQMLDRYPGGIGFVELAPLTDPALVPSAVASALKLPEQPGSTAVEQLVDALATRQLLLILDNCEHLVSAAAELAERLLRACPALAILATSRETLRVPGETAWLTPLLTIPEDTAPALLDHLTDAEAVRLFLERARLAQPDFAVTDANAAAVADVCRRLEGIPLAIEMAAARVRILSPMQLARRLDDSFGVLTGGSRTPLRQRTMRAAIDWSYDLLSQPERQVFHRLAVFARGAALEAIEAVCDALEFARGNVLELLTSLVEKSLVLAEVDYEGAARYRLLEPLRQYAQGRLEASGDAPEARNAHAAFFFQLAERLAVGMAESLPKSSLACLELEHDNLRAALNWLLESRDIERAGHLAVALRGLWADGGRFSEGRAWISKLLALPVDAAPADLRMKLLHCAGRLAYAQGDGDAARGLLEEALALSDGLSANELECSHARMVLGIILGVGGDRATAQRHLRQAVLVAQRLSNPAVESSAWTGLAEVAYHHGDASEAIDSAEQALAAAIAIGSPEKAVRPLTLLGELHCWQNDSVLGRSLLEQGVTGARESRSKVKIARSLQPLAVAVTDLGEQRTALALLTECLTLWKDLGSRLGVAAALEGFAHLAAACRQHERGALLAGAGAALRKAVRAPRTPWMSFRLEQDLAQARQALGEERVARALNQGGMMSQGQAIACALAADLTLPAASQETPSHDRLTKREREVAALIISGLTNREIAHELVVSEHTVARHVEHILQKLGLRSRTLVAARADQYHLW